MSSRSRSAWRSRCSASARSLYTLDTGKRRWLPAVLIAGAIMSHIVVAVFIGIAAVLLWLTRRPLRTLRIAAPIGAVAIAIPSVWLVPLLGNQAYTQSMRYTKLQPQGSFTIWSWLPLGPLRDPSQSFVRALLTYHDPASNKFAKQPLWLPWWIWALAAVAIVAGVWYRRRSTLVLLVIALVMGLLFVEWPADQAVWNTRFLPFWLLTWGFLAAMGATEICRFVAGLVRWSYRWIRDGDLQDARARAWAEVATARRPRRRRAGEEGRGVGSGRAPVRHRPHRLVTARAPRARAHRAPGTSLRIDRDGGGRVGGRSLRVCTADGTPATATRRSRSQVGPRGTIRATKPRTSPHRSSTSISFTRWTTLRGRTATDERCGSRRLVNRTRSTATARALPSSCCRTSRTGASARWKASTSSRRPRPRTTS